MSFKWTFQIAIAVFIIWVYFNPQTKLHSIIAISSMLIFYVLQSYIENKALSKFINEKQADHEELISAICNSSQDLIAYKDFNGKYLYCNQVYLNTINKTLDEIKGKKESDLFSQKDAIAIRKIVLQGKVVKKILKMDSSKKIYDITATPLVLAKNIFWYIGNRKRYY